MNAKGPPQLALLGAAILLLAAVPSRGDLVSGQTMLNPFFGTPGSGDYSGWTLTFPWRDDGGSSRLVFDANDGNATGFFTAQAAGRDLSADPAITGAPDYDAAAARLLGFDFTQSQPFIAVFGGTTGTADYNLYFELDVVTPGGTYRARSQDFGDPTLLSGALSPAFTWQSGGFLGDLVADGGVLLEDISSITYSAVMQIDTVASSAPTAFVTLDNMALVYQVSTAALPKPGETIRVVSPEELELSNLGIGRLYETEHSATLASWNSLGGLFSPTASAMVQDSSGMGPRAFFRLVNHTGAANWTTPTLCAEEDNVNLPLSSLGNAFEIIATHPTYSFTTDNCDPDFTNCTPGGGSDFPFTPFADPGYYDDGTDIVGLVREAGFWRPRGMTVTKDNGSPVADVHFLTLSRKIPDESSWPQYLVLYADGNLRLIPFPAPGRSGVCFGTSVIAGPAEASSRPIAEIAAVDFDTSSLQLTVSYRGGGSAMIDVLEVSRTQARVRLELDHNPSVPIATFRSMFVTDGNADADSIRWIDYEGTTREQTLMTFTAGTGSDWQLYRSVLSTHNTSAPDIRIVLEPAP